MIAPRSNLLPFALPDTDEAEIQEIAAAVHAGWITTGPKTGQFEADFAARVGAKHAIAVNSCTAAMHLALEAIGVQAGDEVITTPYTFAATAEVVRYLHAKPVLVDVRPEDFNLDPTRLEAAITPRTKAIIPVHIAGLPVELDDIHTVAHKHHLRVIEDAAHAFLTLYKDRFIGSLSDFTCFSFYATKAITTGEGGMLCTENDAWAARCRIMALHGISHDAWKRYTDEGTWYYEIIAPGYKYNLTDVAAAMGLAQLRKAQTMWQRRLDIAQRYNQAFEDLPELQIPHDRLDCQHAWHLYMLRLNLDRLSINRVQFVAELRQRNISTSVHFIPLHLHPYYRDTYGYRPEDFPIAYREYLREVSLPIYSKMSDADVQAVIDSVAEVARQYRC